MLIPITFSYAEITPTEFAAHTTLWTDNIFEWHEQGLITPTEFVNAVGYLSEHKIILLEKTVSDGKDLFGDRNISGDIYALKEYLKYCNDCQSLKKYYSDKSYNYEDHQYTIFSYIHSNGMEYKVTKNYEGYLSTFINGRVIPSADVHCPWC